MNGALSGLLVVALEHAVAAPLCTRMLADAGARVIKIERAEGDFARGYDKAVKGESTYFTWLNYGKESLVLNLKQAGDLSLLKKIIQRADILVQNFSPGSLDRLGLSDAKLQKLNPGLIRCAIQGYAPDGPYASRKAYDLLVQAESGLAYVTGTAAEPARVGVSVCDIASGMYGYAAILEALIARRGENRGQSISISMFDAMAHWMAVPLLQYDYTGDQPQRVGLRHPSIAPYGVYATSDDRAILIAVQNDREWQALCEQVFDNIELFKNQMFVTNVQRVQHRPELESAVSLEVGRMTYTHCRQRLESANIAWGDVNDIAGLSAHPQLRRLQIQIESGSVDVPASPIPGRDSSEMPAVPSLGQHSQSIRDEFS